MRRARIQVQVSGFGAAKHVRKLRSSKDWILGEFLKHAKVRMQCGCTSVYKALAREENGKLLQWITKCLGKETTETDKRALLHRIGTFCRNLIVVGIHINNTCSLFLISVQHNPLDTPAPEIRPHETVVSGGFVRGGSSNSHNTSKYHLVMFYVFFMVILVILGFCHQISTELKLA